MRVEFLMDFQSVNECLTSCFTLQITFGKIFFFAYLRAPTPFLFHNYNFLLLFFFFLIF